MHVLVHTHLLMCDKNLQDYSDLNKLISLYEGMQITGGIQVYALYKTHHLLWNV